jgi:hypothetical protein
MPNQFQQSATSNAVMNRHTLACWIIREVDLQRTLRHAGLPIQKVDRDRMAQYVQMYDKATRRERIN